MNIAAILEFLLIVTNIGAAVFLYPIVKRQMDLVGTWESQP